MIIGGPGHGAKITQPARVRAVRGHGVYVRGGSVLLEVAPEDPLPIRRKERAAIVAGPMSQAPLAGAVGVHDVDFPEISGVQLEMLQLLRREFVGRIRIAQRTEDNAFAVR